MINWIKGLGIFSGTLVVGVMALSLTLIMPIISILTVIVAIVVFAGWLSQQYIEYCNEKKKL